MAGRSSGMADDGVYFVNPAASAGTAASLMCCGVSKSGSPAPKPHTSAPSAFIFFAFASIARVNDGVSVVEREASNCIGFPCCGFRTSEFAVVKVFDERLQVIFADLDDFHFSLGVVGRIAGVGGVDHDVLAEFAANGAGRRLAGIGGPENAANLCDGIGALIHYR